MNSTSEYLTDGAVGDATMLPEYWGRWFASIEGSDMDKVKIAVFYQFGSALVELKQLKAGSTLGDVILDLWTAERWVSTFLIEVNNITLPLSKHAAVTLMKAISKLASGIASLNTERVLARHEITDILNSLNEFETVFRHEAENLDIFSVPQKAAYATTTLIQDGAAVIPKSIRDYMPQYAIEELHQMGRCIAFSLPTAAGFHMMRSTESVLHSYWDVVSGGKPRPTLKNGNPAPMGTYIVEVENEGADKKATGVLRQIKDLHRNPLMHPDVVLNMTEALVLLGVAASAIMAMIEEMKKKGVTPTVPPSSSSTTP